MTEIKDGGAAFPGCVRNTKGKLDRNPGMSLRDWFAGQAMAAFYSSFDCRDVNTSPNYLYQDALIFYDMADAMLKARENNND